MSVHREAATDLEGDAPHIDYFRAGEGIPSRTVLIDAEALPDDPFDEDLSVREDPHLWTRLLGDVEAERVAEPTAVKRRRPESLTSDATEVYEAELQEITDLAARDDDLAAVREQRRARTEYRHGRRLLQRGDRAGARPHLVDAARRGLVDARLVVLLVVSLLPAGSQRVLSLLERLQGWLA